MSDTRYRLRRDVYDSLTEAKGLTTDRQQFEAMGISKATLYRILAGRPPTFATATQMADALDVGITALFERVDAEAAA